MPHNRRGEEVTRGYARHCISSRARRVDLLTIAVNGARWKSIVYYISRSRAGGDESSNNGIYRRCTTLDLNDKGHSSSLRLRTRALRSAELSEIFYEPLRDDGPGEIKRASINVKAQFPSDGYELMEDACSRALHSRRASALVYFVDRTM